jgi:hypothetical protein
MTPVAAPAVTSLAVGPDGTLFGQTPTGIVRFPAAAPQR